MTSGVFTFVKGIFFKSVEASDTDAKSVKNYVVDTLDERANKICHTHTHGNNTPSKMRSVVIEK